MTARSAPVNAGAPGTQETRVFDAPVAAAAGDLSGGGAPIAASEVWRQVMDRAGGRCECSWRRHAAHRGDEGGRCELTTAGARLAAGPLDPGPRPDRTVAVVPVAELRAWCPGCWDEAVKAARRQQRAAEQIARRDGLMAGLFDLQEVSA